ncbi:hypothetical protein MRB53_017815 [Persea americana]|uniref:Uncharacterized protein n=1 Tax=Persea americana TaxID=3435 RepID=A0ACC2M704_PERAE|nr:hypothetical protein MRB53_017815 [Persea americana]
MLLTLIAERQNRLHILDSQQKQLDDWPRVVGSIAWLSWQWATDSTSFLSPRILLMNGYNRCSLLQDFRLIPLLLLPMFVISETALGISKSSSSS